MLLKDFRPDSRLTVPEHLIARAKFPVIDAHNHLLAVKDVGVLLEKMDEFGINLRLMTSTLPIMIGISIIRDAGISTVSRCQTKHSRKYITKTPFGLYPSLRHTSEALYELLSQY